MSNAKVYTLDRLEKSLYVFLEKGKETDELLIPENEVSTDLLVGDIVEIKIAGTTYKISRLETETEDRKDSVAALLEKLKNRN